ncbi:MAG: hypothetical protein ACO1Q7_20385 [Gemmatimonas sp.]
MLMKDMGALYGRLNNVIANFDSIMVDLKKNPKKYINLRIF